MKPPGNCLINYSLLRRTGVSIAAPDEEHLRFSFQFSSGVPRRGAESRSTGYHPDGREASGAVIDLPFSDTLQQRYKEAFCLSLPLHPTLR